MQLDITRKDRQQEGANKWRTAKGIGCLVQPSRFGKTFGAIEFIINPHLAVNIENKVVIIVPSEIIIKQWEDNLKSYCSELDRVMLVTSHYLANKEITIDCSLLVVDELQKYDTAERKAMIDGTAITHKYRLGLTGTYPHHVEWIKELYPIVDELHEDEAIENGWTSPFIEYNILLELPAADKARYERFTKPIQESIEITKPLLSILVREEGRRIFDSELSLLQACSSGFNAVTLQGYTKWITYDRLCNTIAGMMGWHTNLNITVPENNQLNTLWNPNAIHTRGKVFMDYIRKRNELLIDNPVKLQVVGEIIEMNKVPTIVFNESTTFANSIVDYVSARFAPDYKAACYHSRIDSRTMIDPTTGDYFKFTTGERKGLPKILGKDSIKRIVIDGFRNGFYDCLSTAKALDEGLDLPNIEQVICTGGTTNPMTYQQRTARGKTIDDYNPNKVTKIFNLVFDDFVNSSGELIKSRDKTKLILRQQLSGSTIKWIKNTNEINLMVTE